MSTSTTKLGLTKPAPGEKLSRATYNATLDKIDAASINRDKLRHFEAARDNQADAPTGVLWGPGNILGLRVAGSSFNDDFVSNPTTGTDGLRLTKEGIYKVVWMIGNAGSASAQLWHIVCNDGSSISNANNSPLGRVPSFAIPVGDWYICKANNFYVGPNGANIFFKFSSSTAGTNLNHRIRVTKIQ